ncbi:serotonin-gated chloride channel mod-1-like [Penaeus vannamei]|uniref:serotonin-gated chloride channel mod-1-like n=1 Tax=Penaeus vannamei TaxID=6689 RepID=UPI00387F8CBF
MSVSFQCQFDLRWFPFDHQRCSLNFRLSEVESKLVKVIALEPQYLGPEKLPEYQVRAVTMQSRGANGDSGQQLTVRFTNLYRYYLANSYLPSFLLVVISYSTFYFRLEDFNERIMVSITAMLVLVALFSQTSSTILKTTYLKLIDVWYMVCIVVDFVMVMMLALIDFVLHNRSSNRIMVLSSSKNSRSRYFPSNAEKLNKIGRVALPLLFLAFLLVYAVVACVKYVAG